MQAGSSFPGITADERGFREWASVRAPIIRRKAYLMCGNWDTADDLCQEVLVSMYSRWAKVVRGGSVDAYANRVLTGKFVDGTRKPWRRERTVDDLPEAIDNTSNAAMDTVESSDSPLMKALATLPAAQRSVLVLRFVDDLTVEEIASDLGIAAGTVKSRLSRGLEALRSQLADGSSTHEPGTPVAAPTQKLSSLSIGLESTS